MTWNGPWQTFSLFLFILFFFLFLHVGFTFLVVHNSKWFRLILLAVASDLDCIREGNDKRLIALIVITLCMIGEDIA